MARRQQAEAEEAREAKMKADAFQEELDRQIAAKNGTTEPVASAPLSAGQGSKATVLAAPYPAAASQHTPVPPSASISAHSPANAVAAAELSQAAALVNLLACSDRGFS